jgi:multidrug resistance protein MdtO
VPASGSRLADFLRAELAPTPGRARATARLVVASVVATALVVGFRIPEGHWIIIAILTVGLADAGASIQKGIQRLIGTFGGGAIGILVVAVFADEPAVRVPLMGLIAMATLFLSRTTTAPYVFLLGGITSVLVIESTRGSDVNAAVAIGIWRIALMVIGVTMGTAAQVFLWPVDPETVLLGELGARIDVAADVVRRCLAGAPQPTGLTAMTQGALVRHLDLLTNAEARHPSLRQKHVVQLTLVSAVEHLSTGALALERAAQATPGAPTGATASRLRAVLADCERLRAALPGRTAPVRSPRSALPSDEEVAGAGAARLLPALTEMERALGDIDAALGIADEPSADRIAARRRTSLDAPAGSWVTPAFSASNVDDLAFAFKGGLAATICHVLVNGLAWPGTSTSVWTCLLVAQSSYGAMAQKELLRLVGAVAGGLLGLLAILVAMPNLEGLASFLVVVSIGFATAAWVTTGSARIGYAGIQLGVAFSLCTVDVPGTTVNLLPARDRVVGILIGIVVTGLVFRGFGHPRARQQMRLELAKTLRALGDLARVGVSGLERVDAVPARGHRWAVYQHIATTLRLHDEGQFEPGAGLPDAVVERDAALRVVGDAQSVFLALLEIVRHRLNVDVARSFGAAQETVHALAVGIVDALGAAADRVEGRASAPMPDLRALRERAEAAIAAAPGAGHVQARLLLYRDVVGTVLVLTRDVDARAWTHDRGATLDTATVRA